jgi:hypothetical protein
MFRQIGSVVSEGSYFEGELARLYDTLILVDRGTATRFHPRYEGA